VWGTEEAYRAAFTEFADTVDPDGFLVCCVDDEGARDLADLAASRGRHVVRVGEAEDAALRATDVVLAGATSSFTVVRDARPLGRMGLRIPGRHYVLDALAALAVGLELGCPFDGLRDGLESFAGAGRRMEPKGEAGGVRVYDSYAHHPREIAADLEAARAVAGDGRLLVVFQPHLVSRTREFGPAMGRALGAADEVVVLEVYVAREEPDPAVTAALVADAVPLPAVAVERVSTLAQAETAVAARARPGDLVLTLGAGDVTHVGPGVLARLGDHLGERADA
jgi:UDP-N-acetylmuramate--alanine ligase